MSTACHINMAIYRNSLTSYSSCDVPISEGPVNLSWPAIMKTVNEDPHAFYAEGGWNFLTGSGSVRLPLCLFLVEQL